MGKEKQSRCLGFTSSTKREAACKRAQQVPTLLRQQCWELLRAGWQWSANGCNNSQQVMDLQCIVGRIQPIGLCNPCVISVRGPYNVGRTVKTDPTLLRYAPAITEQRNVGSCWLKSLTGFKLCATTCNRVCKRTQHVTSNNVASVCTGLEIRHFYVVAVQ